jgi:hypothetical protein
MNSTDKEPKSKCCNASVEVDCSEDFGGGDDEHGSTCCYICQKCGQACDVQPHSTDKEPKYIRVTFSDDGHEDIIPNPKFSQPHSTDWQETPDQRMNRYNGEVFTTRDRFTKEELARKVVSLQQEIDASYKRGKIEVLESLPTRKREFHIGDDIKAIDGYNDAKDNLITWKNEQLNQTHREGK